MKRLWLLVALLGASEFAAAQSCVIWRGNASPTNARTSTQCSTLAREQVESELVGSGYPTAGVDSASCSPDGVPSGIGVTSSCTVGYHLWEGSSFTSNPSCSAVAATGLDCSDLGPDDPPPPPPEECTAELGDGFWTTSTEPIAGATWCNGLCEMTAGTSQCGGPPGLQTCNTWTEVTALSCSGSPDTDGDGAGDSGGPASDPPAGSTPEEDATGEATPPAEAAENCVDIGDGEYCASPQGDGQCGYVNDTYTCLDHVREDECKVLGDGGRVCGSAANSTPPVPDNGTPGQLATPDGQVSQTTPDATPGIPGGVTNIYNYYGSSTVAGSTRDPGTTGASGESTSGSPHAPAPGAATGGGGTGGNGTCTSADCEAGPLPELADIGTLGEAMQEFWNDLQEVPIIEAASNIAPSFGTGSCPSWSTSVDLYTSSINIDFTSVCGMWLDIAPALTFVCLVMFGLLAFRVLFSA